MAGKIPKTPSAREQKRKHREQLAKDGGLIQVSFTFDGKKHVQSHRLTQAEMEGQMILLKQHGVGAFSSATLQVSIWGAGQLGRHCVEEAFKEYARINYREEEDLNTITASEVVDQLRIRHEPKEDGSETTK